MQLHTGEHTFHVIQFKWRREAWFVFADVSMPWGPRKAAMLQNLAMPCTFVPHCIGLNFPHVGITHTSLVA